MNYHFAHTKRFDNIILEQYSPGNGGIGIFKNLVATLSNSDVANEILRLLMKVDAPDTARLSRFARQTDQLFRLYAQAEPYSTRYYSRILNVLHPFMLLVQVHSELIEKQLVKKLEFFLYSKSDSNDHTVYSDDVDKIEDSLISYLDSSRNFRRELQVLLEQESEQNRGIRVTSPVEQYLLKLSALVEISMTHTDALIDHFRIWKDQLSDNELQETYN